jgi:hypothetical protein
MDTADELVQAFRRCERKLTIRMIIGAIAIVAAVTAIIKL